MNRRSVIVGVPTITLTAASLPTLTAYAANDSQMGERIVETSSGKVRRAPRSRLRFKGIPYDADTGGPSRFQPPKRIAWTGVRDALDYGAGVF